MAHMLRTPFLSITALAIAALLLLGGCQHDSGTYNSAYQYDGGQGDYHTGYIITEKRQRTRPRYRSSDHAPRVSVGYRTGYSSYSTGYHGGGGYISFGHRAHYRHGSYSIGYSGGHHRSHRSHGGNYGHHGSHRGGNDSFRVGGAYGCR